MQDEAYCPLIELIEFARVDAEADASRKGHEMEMEYGPFGIANLIVDAGNRFAVAWGAAASGERTLWLLLFATIPAAGYAVCLLAGKRDSWAID
jgi:hypothetical protein